jgi:hypothetical protein
MNPDLPSSTEHLEDQARTRVIPNGIKPSMPPLGFNAITLLGQAKNDVELYSGPAETPRRRKYKEEHPLRVNDLRKTTAIRLLKDDAAENSAITSLCVGICGGIGSIGWIAGPVGGAPGTTLGIAGGFCIAGAIIKHRISKQINIDIMVSDHYSTWKAEAIAKKAYPVFKNFINASDVFMDFLCPLSDDICQIPLKAPDGRTYDQESIHQYIKTTGKKDHENVLSPFRGEEFCKNDLVVDVDYCRKLIIKAHLVYHDVVKFGKDNEIREGIEAVTKNTYALMEEIRQKMVLQIYSECEESLRKKDIEREDIGRIIEEKTKQWDFRAVF